MAASSYYDQSASPLEECFPDVAAAIVQRWGHAEFDPYILRLTDAENAERLLLCPEYGDDLALLLSIHRDAHRDTVVCNDDEPKLPKFFI